MSSGKVLNADLTLNSPSTYSPKVFELIKPRNFVEEQSKKSKKTFNKDNSISTSISYTF